jgi:hypothetical protein
MKHRNDFSAYPVDYGGQVFYLVCVLRKLRLRGRNLRRMIKRLQNKKTVLCFGMVFLFEILGGMHVVDVLVQQHL